jgi:DNA-binding transcriptional LysR family regulator
MTKSIDWHARIGRRLRLRDLHVLFAVAELGSMAKAGARLGVSQPAVSEVIAKLEHAVGAQLLDRTPKGVVPTIYGRALLKRSVAAFDELRQGIRDIEFMSDSATGELRLACPESIAAAVLPPVIEQLSRKYPRVALHVTQVKDPTQQFSELRERNLDLVLARLLPTPTSDTLDDLNVDVLFNDRLVIAVGTESPWARRRRIALADLVDEPWVLTPSNTWNSFLLEEAFRAGGLPMPRISIVAFSLHLRIHLLTTGRYVTAFPNSVLRLNEKRFSLKALRVEMPARPWPIAIVTLRNRTLSPVVGVFIKSLRTCMQ